ncbi:NAD-dependent epimerase/dehydratase family protein [Dactylosporangium cerinum]|uniref:NAD-dependent epimerase/dehydratase family protein n=1 Tax=Dactylosporangium cerinum TaxID=1434730 RepID=A0ABV9VSU2_9ACTN
MNVTVLGASGFVGSAVTAALARRPIRLRAVARRPAAVPPGALAEVETVAADLTEPGVVEAAVAGADAVVHLVLHESGWRGADDDPDSGRTNVGILGDVVRARRDGSRPVVVFAGSTSQVGPPPRVPIDGTEPDRPATAYDRQKLAAEELLRAATADGLVRGVTLRLPTIFGGSAQDRGVVAAMMRRALAGEPLTVWADGAVQRDLLYVDDTADAFVAALDHADVLAGRRYLLGTGVGVSLRELFGAIAGVVAGHTGRPAVPVVSVPPPPGTAATDGHSMVVDASAFRSATGWRPLVPLPEALRRTVTVLG